MKKESPSTENEVMLETALAMSLPKSIEKTPYVVLHESQKLESIEAFYDRPVRKKSNPEFLDAASFVTYFKEFQKPQSKIFARCDANKDGSSMSVQIIAIFDFHQSVLAEWCSDRATYRISSAPEWAAWMLIHKKALSQSEFAEFLESNSNDVVRPAGCDLLELVNSLTAKTNAEYTSVIRNPNGGSTLTYEEKTEARGKGGLEIPSKITLGLPVFYRGSRYEIDAFLRIRIKERQAFITLEISKPDLIIHTAFVDVLKEISETTEITPLIGSY